MYKQVKRRKIEKLVEAKVQTAVKNVKKKVEEMVVDVVVQPEPDTVDRVKNINDLPVDILFEVFSHLTPSDRLVAGLVCKDWFTVAKHNTFLKNCVVKIQNRQFREERYSKNGLVPCTMELFAKSNRKFPNYDFEKIDLNLKSAINSYKAIAETIQQLALYKCKVKIEVLENMLRMSPNLKILKFDGMDRNITLQWEQATTVVPITDITHLQWRDTETFLADKIFNRLLEMCPKLNTIELVAGTQHFCSPKCMEFHMNMAGNRFAITEESFCDFLDKFGPQLKSCTIDELNKPYPYVMSLCQVGKILQLETLILKNSEIPVEEMNDFLETQKSLKVLHLQGVKINDQTMAKIAAMNNLQELKLQQKCLIVANAGIKEIKSLSKLKTLELHAFPTLTVYDGFNEGILESQFDKIESIGFYRLCIEADIFQRMILKFSRLKVLKMIDCFRFLTNDIMQLIFEHLIHLEELDCEDATKVSNIGFLGRKVKTGFKISRLTNLRKANFSGMSRLNDTILKTFTNRTLQELDMSRCHGISTTGVKQLISQCPSLETLKLNSNPQISSRILYYALNQTCAPRLKEISIKWCAFHSE